MQFARSTELVNVDDKAAVPDADASSRGRGFPGVPMRLGAVCSSPTGLERQMI